MDVTHGCDIHVSLGTLSRQIYASGISWHPNTSKAVQWHNAPRCVRVSSCRWLCSSGDFLGHSRCRTLTKYGTIGEEQCRNTNEMAALHAVQIYQLHLSTKQKPSCTHPGHHCAGANGVLYARQAKRLASKDGACNPHNAGCSLNLPAV
jgi:hypothetical protein